jgi:hypothetical protein
MNQSILHGSEGIKVSDCLHPFYATVIEYHRLRNFKWADINWLRILEAGKSKVKVQAPGKGFWKNLEGQRESKGDKMHPFLMASVPSMSVEHLS